MHKIHCNPNIYYYVFISFVFFTFLLPIKELCCQESPREIELLKRISSHYLEQTIQSSNNIDEVVTKIGITKEELRQICEILSINLDFQDESKPQSLPSVQKLTSMEYEPDAVVNFTGDSSYILLVEKSVHKIYLLKYENGKRSLENIFDCKTGKNKGDKLEEGDHKTPEGIFYLINKYSHDAIRRIVGKARAYQYGELAFATDFPNHIDQMTGKNGSGIWLHGTDEPFSETSPLDTRGCVVTTNETITTLSRYITLSKTPLIIDDTLDFNSKQDHIVLQQELLSILEEWRSAWEEKRIDDYISFYADSFRENGKNRIQWKQYKASIFKNYTINHIKLENIVVLKHDNWFLARFIQDYSASNLLSTNTKTLYFIKDNNSWKIVAEKFGTN